MPRIRSEDNLNDPLKLLAQYRDICENMGGLRAVDSSIPKQLQERLARVEAQLCALLTADGGVEAGSTAKPSRASVPDQATPSISRGGVAPDPKGTSGTPTARTFPPVGAAAARPTSQDAPTSTIARVFSDGACIGNPGPGGYAAVVRVSGHPEKILTGGKARTTNNEMEMTAAIEGLRYAASTGAIEIAVFSDSEYLVKGINDWMKGWLRNGWKTRTGHPVKNRELWEELHRLSQGKAVTWSWVAGHSGHPENELCDSLAVAAAKKASGRS